MPSGTDPEITGGPWPDAAAEAEPDTSRCADRSSLIAFGLLAYVVAVGLFLLLWNDAAGGMVQRWHEEYVGSDGEINGSGKWRYEEGRDFQNVALLFGTWVYPFSIAAAVLFVREAARRRGVFPRLLGIVCAVVPLYIVYQLERVGLARAVWSF